MPLKYIERKTFRVILPSGKAEMVRIPMVETPRHLLRKLGMSEKYEVLYESKPLPLDKTFEELKIGRQVRIKGGRKNGVGEGVR